VDFWWIGFDCNQDGDLTPLRAKCGAFRDDVEDGGPPPPPPPPGRPGISIVAGGLLMTSPKYRAFVATGEAPGANGVLSSPKYRFVGGVIGTTQPK